jgi:hypothetical protein
VKLKLTARVRIELTRDGLRRLDYPFEGMTADGKWECTLAELMDILGPEILVEPDLSLIAGDEIEVLE